MATASRGLIVCGRQLNSRGRDRLARRQRRIPRDRRADLPGAAEERPRARRVAVRLDRARSPGGPRARAGDSGSGISRRRSRSASGSDRSRACTRSRSIPTTAGTTPTARAATILRADPTAAAERCHSASDDAENTEWTGAWKRHGAVAGAAIQEALAVADAPTEPAVHAALGRLYADGDLRLRPRACLSATRGLRRGRACSGPVPVQPRREQDRRPGLVGDRRGGASDRPTWLVLGDLCLYRP